MNGLALARRYRLELVGLLGLLALAGAVLLLTAHLGGRFADVVRVAATVPGDAPPLLVGAEVKLHGVPVGRVTDARLQDDGSNLLSLELDPDDAALVPAGVTARVLPSTLFGLEFVDLAPPGEVREYGLQAGTHIAPDTSAASVGTTRLLADVFPALEALDPAQLNATLTALADGLEGRGDQLGRTLSELNTYLAGIGPQVPQLLEDVRKLTELSGTLEQSAPDLLAFLRNAVAAGQDNAQARQQILALTGAVTTAAGTVDGVLTENEQELTELTTDLLPVLQALGESRTDLARGVRELAPTLEALASVLSLEPALNVDARLPGDSRCRYTDADRPRYVSDLRSPRSSSLDPQTCEQRAAPPATAAEPAGLADALPDALPATRSSGSAQERAALQELLAPVLDVPATQVPDLTALLFGPILRGGLLGQEDVRAR